MTVSQRVTRSILRRRQAIAGVIIGAGLSLNLAACGNSSNTSQSGTGQKKDVEITLVGYAVPKAAHDVIIRKFAAKWQQEQNQKVTFKQTYGGSGSQTRAVIDGLPADIVHLAVGSDVDKLAQSSLVAPDWQKKLPNNAIVARSVVAIVTRPGNPKQIKSFADLARPDVKWVTANPKTSGGARWNFLALWNSAIKAGGNEAKAAELVTNAFKNVVVQPKDAREATDAFAKQGQGDALLNYENETIFAKERGQALDYVVPDVNISIESPVAIVDKNVEKHGNREVVEAFARYMFSPESQAEFVKLGYRPAATIADPRFPQVKTLTTIAEYGGWNAVQKKFFEDGGVYDKIEAGKK
ncbi:sulfate ABC transporter substrate-binding protein [Chamaesiphon minutus]|uniref:Sulfate/thiosulfate-binding protein n=1 Tax=Chamaesiphon minutus (strain ATCC 27169 / PCC 6605) TaxID=1173020 RepID=K9UN27_CHAP6|nr:sulfate ABC transporter substrate-binding protein [Chamaesiphon minutus]AFY96078.1 sulfate/thiosulfate-binding protein [Chamaesiphon minutus PCC 6605]